MKSIKITPIPKPRMTQSDRWKKRKCVVNYFKFKDQLKGFENYYTDKLYINFYLPMPKSWSKKKRLQKTLCPHDQKPDIDNLVKAYMDATMPEDKEVWDIRASKFWAEEGKIVISEVP